MGRLRDRVERGRNAQRISSFFGLAAYHNAFPGGGQNRSQESRGIDCVELVLVIQVCLVRKGISTVTKPSRSRSRSPSRPQPFSRAAAKTSANAANAAKSQN